MTDIDPVLTRLAALASSAPPSELSAKIRAAAARTLTPRRVHPLWTCAVAGSVLSYLCWALYFASRLY
jgi:hypothetical protein